MAPLATTLILIATAAAAARPWRATQASPTPAVTASRAAPGSA